MESVNKTAKTHYLDASALIKLILDCQDEKPGREELRYHFNSESKPFYTTSICFAETIGILKKKQRTNRTVPWRKEDNDNRGRYFLGGIIFINTIFIFPPCQHRPLI